MLATTVETAGRISRRLWLIAALACTGAAPPTSGQEPTDLLPNPVGGDYQIRGRTVADPDGAPLSGVEVRLFRAEGRVAPPVEMDRVLSDADGRFEFLGLEPPRPHEPLDRLQYAVVAESKGRPPKVDPTVALHAGESPPDVVIVIAGDEGVLTGKVVDEQGRPVAGATVMQNSFLQRAIPGVAWATTDAEGRFTIERVPIWKKAAGGTHAIVVRVVHPDYADALGAAPALPADITVTMPTGCVVTGVVVDGLTGQPATGVVATIELAERLPRRNLKVAEAIAEKAVAVDAAGRFRVVVAEGRYNICAEATDRVCAAVANRECPAGETVELPPMTMTEGGYILGRVLDARTGQPVAATQDGEPITVGLFGPSHPRTGMVRAAPLATVDAAGRFLLAAAPGENFPYLVNHRGDRMVANAVKHPPVVVAEGKTTKFDLLISPAVLRFQANIPPVVRRKLAPLP